MPPKTEAQTHILVKVKCPHCAASGKVDMSRLDQSFTCGKCQRKFHVDVRQTRKGVREDKTEDDPAAAQLNLDSPTMIDRVLKRIPRSALIAIPAAIALFALWWFLGEMLLPGEELPVSAEERAVYVVKSLLDRKSAPINRLLFKANSIDTNEWIKYCRPLWPPIKPEDPPLQIATKTTNYPRSKDPAKTGYIAVTSVVVIVTNPSIKTHGTAEIMTYWVKPTDESDWLFDLKRSRAVSGK